jgi:6,7-dimethyl-8-ribityllumazine synthase
MAEPSRVPQLQESVEGAHFLIIEARFYDSIGVLLLEGATQALLEAQARWSVVKAPGALEIPAAAAILLDAAEKAGAPYAGVIALGCVIRGETYHFEIVAGESARALMDLAVARLLPLGNGILTVEDEAQAIVRADKAHLDKGGDAARAALAMFRLKQHAEKTDGR